MSKLEDFIIENTTLISYEGKDSVVEIPNGIREGSFTFENYQDKMSKYNFVKKVIIPNSVENVGSITQNFLCMEEIVFTDDCDSIKRAAAFGRKNLRQIVWPKNVKVIGKSSFQESGLEELFIPETVEIIEEHAFQDSKLKKVEIPKTVKIIRDGAFGGTPDITIYDSLDFEKSMVGWIGHSPKLGFVLHPLNATMHDHIISVRSAADDKVKYKVHMPASKKTYVNELFTHAWNYADGFNFLKIDNNFDELSKDEKINYVIDRLSYQDGISEELLDKFEKYIPRQATGFAEKIFEDDAVESLDLLEKYGIVNQKNIKDRINSANSHKATLCVAWLLDWKNKNGSKETNYKV